MSIEIFKGFIRYKICIVEIYWRRERQRQRNIVRETERKREREIDEKEREINGKLSFECTSPFRCWIVSYLITRLRLINYIFYYLFI